MRKTFLTTGLCLALALGLNACARGYAYKPEQSTAYGDYLTAVYARGQGDQAQATRSYLDLIAKEPGNLALLEGAYSFFIFNGDIAHALPIARSLNALDPDHVPTGMLLALDGFRHRDFNRMETSLSRVTGFGFDNLMAPLIRGWALAIEGRGDDALQALGELLKNPKFEPFYAEHRALVLDFLGRGSDAEAAYRVIVNGGNLTSLQPVLALAALLVKSGERAEAKSLLEKVDEKIPGSVEVAAALAKIEAGENLESPAASPDHALAAAFLRVGNEQGRNRAFLPAVVYARFALFLDPALEEAELYLGNLFLNQRYPEMALAAYSAIAPTGLFGETAALRKAYALNVLERYDEAIAAVLPLANREPPSLNALVTLGDLHRGRENFAEALAYYQRAFEIAGIAGEGDWALLFSRGICFERLGRWEEAEADLKQALVSSPDEPDILNYLGYSWIDRGINLAAGRALIEKAVALSPGNGFILDSLGWAQYRMGEYEAAVETLERAVGLEPGDPEINDHLGDAYWKAGREREASFQWTRALVLGADDEMKKNLEAKLAAGLPEAANPDGRRE